MCKKILAAVLLLNSLRCFANDADPGNIDKQRDEWIRQHFVEQGLPVPDGGVNVVPERKLSGYRAFKAERNEQRASLEQLGYIKDSSPEIQSLLNFGVTSQKQLAKNNPVTGIDENLHRDIGEIPMAYLFRGVPTSVIAKPLGVAPAITYINGKGWAGAVQFFEKTGIGNCKFIENNLKFSHGSANISAESATYDVNNKVTLISVTGEPGYGFLYEVSWFDNNYFRELKCANQAFSKITRNLVLDLARTIDING